MDGDPLASLPWAFYEPGPEGVRTAHLARHPTLGVALLVVQRDGRGIAIRPQREGSDEFSPVLFTRLSAEELLPLEVVPFPLVPPPAA